MFRIIITISIIFLSTIMGIISLINLNYKGAVIWLGLSIVVLFLMSYSKSLYQILKNRFSTNYILKLTKKIFSDIAL